MSTSNSQKSDSEEENKSKTEKEKKEKEKLMDPLTLLSSDLLKEINDFDDNNFWEKKEIINDNILLDKLQKQNIDNNLNIPEINKDSNNNNDFLNFKVFKREGKEKNKNNNYKKNQKRMAKKQNSFCLNNKSLYLNTYNNDNSMFMPNQNQFNNNQYQNLNNGDPYNNIDINNLNFFNNSFTMDGKQGWICNHCKNFNYESKHFIL